MEGKINETPVVRKELDCPRPSRDRAAGTYDTPAKLEEALERLLGRVASGGWRVAGDE